MNQLSTEYFLLEYTANGYHHLENADWVAACKEWEKAWNIVKVMATSNMRNHQDFVAKFPTLKMVFHSWCYDFMFELHNAGLDDSRFHQVRFDFIQDILHIFPDEDEDFHLNFGRGQAEALWLLGKTNEAEQKYAELTARLPDEGWAYIGWSDEYWLADQSSKDYQRAEEILLPALQNPLLKDRRYVLERLFDLYEEWGRPEKGKALRNTQRKPELARYHGQKGKKSTKRGRRKK
jgi:hypothetical protein